MHADMMARAEGELSKRIVHFLMLLSVFVDRHRAKDHERTSISVFCDDPHAHRGTRYAIGTDRGHTIEVKNFGYRHGAPEVIAALAGGEDIDPARY